MWTSLLDPNFIWVLSGSTLLGMSSGVIGAFALLRKRSLLGDVLAHAALPGVCLAFMLTGAKSLAPLLIGASLTGYLGVKCIDVITRNSRIKEDTALGLVLTVFFGVGVMLLTSIQHSGAGSQAGLDSFLFGQSATLVGRDVVVMAVVSALLVVAVILFFKEFKLLCFDQGFGNGLGLPMRRVDNLLMTLIVLSVMIGLQAVGVVLMAAMLITPGVAARYWTERLEHMVALSGAFGGVSGIAGTIVSAMGPRLPTGPLIVLAATGIFVISLLAAPRRGLVAKGLRFFRLRTKIARENLLRDVYELYELSATDATIADETLLSQGIDCDKLVGKPSNPLRARRLRLARRLEKEGLLRLDTVGDRTICTLTQRGLEEAWDVVRRHRLWEMFLMHEADLQADHVDRDADDLEHFLTPELVEALEKLLQAHHREPRLLPSVHPLEPPLEQPGR